MEICQNKAQVQLENMSKYIPPSIYSPPNAHVGYWTVTCLVGIYNTYFPETVKLVINTMKYWQVDSVDP